MGLVAIEAACASYGKLRVRDDHTHLHRSYLYSIIYTWNRTLLGCILYLLLILTFVKHCQDEFYVLGTFQSEFSRRSLLVGNNNMYTITDCNFMYSE